MATTTDNKVTYLFLASRLYPFPQDDLVYNYYADQSPEIAKKAGQEIVALDVTTSFTNNWEGSVTSYPVSSGSEISDHITIKNNKYSLQGIISDTPMELHKQESLGEMGTGSDRTYAAIDLIEKMYQSKVLFTLFSEYQRIDNCVITSVSFEQAGEFAVRFKIEIEKIRLAYAKAVTLNVSSATKKKVASNQNGGGTTKNQIDTNKYRENRDAAISKNNATGG